MVGLEDGFDRRDIVWRSSGCIEQENRCARGRSVGVVLRHAAVDTTNPAGSRGGYNHDKRSNYEGSIQCIRFRECKTTAHHFIVDAVASRTWTVKRAKRGYATQVNHSARALVNEE